MLFRTIIVRFEIYRLYLRETINNYYLTMASGGNHKKLMKNHEKATIVDDKKPKMSEKSLLDKTNNNNNNKRQKGSVCVDDSTEQFVLSPTSIKSGIIFFILLNISSPYI